MIASREIAGGARRDRTADLVIANDALSQLSYGPVHGRGDRRGDRKRRPFTIPVNGKSRTTKIGILSAISYGLPLFGGNRNDI